MQAVYHPDVRELFEPSSTERLSLRSLERALQSWKSLLDYDLRPGALSNTGEVLTMRWVFANYTKPSSHSGSFRQFHEWVGVHTNDLATTCVAVRKGPKRKNGKARKPGRLEPLRSPEGQANKGPAFDPITGEAAPQFRDGDRPIQLIFEGVVMPLLPFIKKARALFVPEELWDDLTGTRGEVYSTGYSYMGVNIFGDASIAGAAPAVSFKANSSGPKEVHGGSYDVSSGKGVGLFLHCDDNNRRCVAVMGRGRASEHAYESARACR